MVDSLDEKYNIDDDKKRIEVLLAELEKLNNDIKSSTKVIESKKQVTKQENIDLSVIKELEEKLSKLNNEIKEIDEQIFEFDTEDRRQNLIDSIKNRREIIATQEALIEKLALLEKARQSEKDYEPGK